MLAWGTQPTWVEFRNAEGTILSLNPEGPLSLKLPALNFSSVKGEGRGRQVPGGVWQEAGGALDGELGPPTLVPRLKHLAEAAAGH